MSFRTRMLGFAITFVLGLLFVAASLSVLMMPRQFVKLYTLGSGWLARARVRALFHPLSHPPSASSSNPVLLLLSSFFLVGPAQQLANMVQPHRLAATAAFLLSLLLTMIAALKWQLTVVSLVFVFIQMLAAAWCTSSSSSSFRSYSLPFTSLAA